jgi:hypothetical protein
MGTYLILADQYAEELRNDKRQPTFRSASLMSFSAFDSNSRFALFLKISHECEFMQTKQSENSNQMQKSSSKMHYERSVNLTRHVLVAGIQGIISAKPFMVSQFFGVLVCKDQIGAHVGYQLDSWDIFRNKAKREFESNAEKLIKDALRKVG